MKAFNSLNQRQLFTIFISLFLGLEFVGILAALLGFFQKNIFIIYLILACLFLIYVLAKNWQVLKVDVFFGAVILLAIIFITLFSAYSTPTIFSGQNQGSFSEAAIRLAQNHQLNFSSVASMEFFKIYGPGKALNFPGFSYASTGQLTTQFSLGYIAWLAIFYALFGLFGLTFANAVTFWIFSLSFYLLARNYLNKRSALLASVLVATNFVFAWFFKFTLNENIALALVWFGILELIWFLKNEEKFYLYFSLLSFYLLAFSRLEAWAFLAVIFLIIFFKYRRQKFFADLISWKFGIILLFLALIYIWNIKINSYFYLYALKGLYNSFFLAKEEIGASAGILSPLIYVLKVFSIYGLINFLLLGVISVFYFLAKKKYEILIPLLIVLPIFFYLINPSISPDHPWMLRRFTFAIIPATILYSIILLDYFLRKKIFFYLLFLILLATNIFVLLPYGAYSENSSLLKQTETISQNFQAKDLVLVDRLASGSGWSMMTGPLNFLFDKQAVYFFNPKDLEKIDQSRFHDIYFIIPDQSLDFYQAAGILEKLQLQKDYQIETSQLGPDTNYELPPIVENSIHGGIYKLAK